mmetsp:Transcript_6888/g.23495  ORF Transcript_6888/g.23495 Transcript_6888/m.23495 type:complete len:224 (-) Transcript_6888:1173-1844(-)
MHGRASRPCRRSSPSCSRTSGASPWCSSPSWTCAPRPTCPAAAPASRPTSGAGRWAWSCCRPWAPRPGTRHRPRPSRSPRPSSWASGSSGSRTRSARWCSSPSACPRRTPSRGQRRCASAPTATGTASSVAGTRPGWRAGPTRACSPRRGRARTGGAGGGCWPPGHSTTAHEPLDRAGSKCLSRACAIPGTLTVSCGLSSLSAQAPAESPLAVRSPPGAIESR